MCLQGFPLFAAQLIRIQGFAIFDRLTRMRSLVLHTTMCILALTRITTKSKGLAISCKLESQSDDHDRHADSSVDAFKSYCLPFFKVCVGFLALLEERCIFLAYSATVA